MTIIMTVFPIILKHKLKFHHKMRLYQITMYIAHEKLESSNLDIFSSMKNVQSHQIQVQVLLNKLIAINELSFQYLMYLKQSYSNQWYNKLLMHEINDLFRIFELLEYNVQITLIQRFKQFHLPIIYYYQAFMNSNSPFQMFQQFIQATEIRHKIKIPLDEQFQNKIDLMEYLIRCAFEKGAKANYRHIKPNDNSESFKAFQRAFKEFNQVQKLIYYNKAILFLDDLINQHFTPPQMNSLQQKQCKIYLKGSISWKPAILKFNPQKQLLCTQKQGKIRVYYLQNYIFRNSKTSDYNSFVLECISEKISSKAHQVYFGFKDIKLYRQWHKAIKTCIEYIMWRNIKQKIYPQQIISLINSKKEFQTQAQAQNKHQNQNLNQHVITQKVSQTKIQNIKLSHSTIIPSKKKSDPQRQSFTRSQSKRYSIGFQQGKQQQLSQCHSVQLKCSDSQVFFNMQNNYQGEYQKQLKEQVFGQLLNEDIICDQNQNSVSKIKINIFSKLLPDYNLNQIQKIENYEEAFRSQTKNFTIYKQKQSNQKLKLFLQLTQNNPQLQKQDFANFLSNTQHFNLINSQIQQMSIKTLLNSENSAIIYQKNKQFNRLYRSRDLVLIRHVFQVKQSIIIVDKSITNNNIPPFTTIVRAQTQTVIKISFNNDKIKIFIDFIMVNQGYLKDFQELNLNIKYLKGFECLFQGVKKVKQLQINQVFSTEWIINSKQIIEEKQQQQNREVLCEKFQKDIIKQEFTDKQKNQSPIILKQFSSMEKMQEQGQLQQGQSQNTNKISKIVRKVNDKEQVILSDQYLTYKHNTKPSPVQPYPYQFLSALNGENPMWQGDWSFPEEGGLIFINKKKIDDQKNVLKFILSQVAKNVLSGKSIMNISFPVDIFSAESNLQKFLLSLAYAPILLQPVVKSSDLDRFVCTMAYGITMSPVYLGMEKPFNPILGETFQCYIQGCPGYAEQLFHHPPIASILLYGRGYTISAQLQAKMKLNINSGTGSNQGIYKIVFDDGYQICYISPSGEVCGLAYGDRKFNMIQKCYAWSNTSQLFLQVAFNPKKKGFFGKQEVPADYFQGKVLKVKEQFLQKLTKSKQQSPKKTDILQEYGVFNGNWDKQIRYQNKVLLDFQKIYPLQLKYENYPLPSDANWREDIHYRRTLSITKAQIWKQKLQILQRNDKKLRQLHFKKNKK